MAGHDAGAQVVLALGHLGGVQEFEFAAARLHDKHFAGEVHHVDLAVRSGGRALEISFAGQVAAPGDFAGGFHAEQFLLRAIEDVKLAFVKERRGHVAVEFARVEGERGFRRAAGGLHVALPREGGVIKGAVAAEFHGEDGRVLRPATKHYARARAGRWHKSPARDAFGIPGAPAPEFLARLRVRAAHAIATGDEQFGAAFVRVGHRRGVGFEGFLAGIRGTEDAPKLLAGRGIHREQEGFGLLVAAAIHGLVALEHEQVKLPVEQERAAAERPLEGELAVVLLDVAAPGFVALQVEADEFAGAVEEPDVPAVAGGRGVRERAHAVASVALDDFLAPEFLAGLAVDGDGDAGLRRVIGGGNEDGVADHDRRRTAWAGQRSIPRHAFGAAELHGEILLRTGAVVVRPAPVRPIGGVEREETCGENQRRGEGANGHAHVSGVLLSGRWTQGKRD